MCIIKLELNVLLRLCLKEVSVYVVHASVHEMMNEGVSMYGVHCYECNDLCERCGFTCTHIQSLSE